MSAELSVESLKKTFGKKTAVRSVSFSMSAGEVVGLLGPNGAGKTTVFYMIAGFLTPTDGVIRLNQQDITRLPMYKRAQAGIAYLPQEASVFRRMSVEDNILAVLESRPGMTPADRQKKLDGLLEELGITALRKQKAYTLSGGERRRTEIARALAIDPHFLLLDEPFAGIDPIAVFEIKKIITQLANQGIGVLITDHNVRDTLDITHRACIINVGEILTQGSKDEILNDDMARRIYLGEHFSM